LLAKTGETQRRGERQAEKAQVFSALLSDLCVSAFIFWPCFGFGKQPDKHGPDHWAVENKTINPPFFMGCLRRGRAGGNGKAPQNHSA
jgi:hypothetical protein